jgi:hypothetical protein
VDAQIIKDAISNFPSEKEHQTDYKEGVTYFDQGHLEYREGIPFLYETAIY